MLWRWQPGDPRPDPFNAAGGGLDLTVISGSIPAPAPDVLAKEREAFRRLAAATPAPNMEVQLAPLHGNSACYFPIRPCQMCFDLASCAHCVPRADHRAHDGGLHG